MQQEKAYQGCRWLRSDTIWGAASFRNYTSLWSVLWEPGIWLERKHYEFWWRYLWWTFFWWAHVWQCL